ncbi:hypothetical protein C8K36_102260 [Rhodococcus sp. OK519]|nr:hypothetical protein C8K36_102260 [Rhodococcus sp. OK519]
MHHNFIPSSDADRPTPAGARRGMSGGGSAAVRARALEIVGILYRCDSDLAAQQLMRHSQENNLRIAALAEGLVATVDGPSYDAGANSQTTLAAHFWLREIRRLGHTPRRTDRRVRHVTASAGCVSGARGGSGGFFVQQSDPKRVDFPSRV